ncbi:antibiotic biosynthesis monooxygenase [Nonomuraea sp. NBC_00507]|uniref:antibiotic biosynthesis monooxygenase family protein n=1 Tax=Nonomuraea sp. NBC_00507 TaxID=2976002 RepID=UPI002E1719BD
MITLAELDASTPYGKQLQSAGDGPVTLINTFVAPEGKTEEVLAAWQEDAAYFKSQPGFISAQLHQGIAGSRVLVNIAVWESGAHLRAAFSAPEFGAALERYPDGTIAYPHLLEKVAVPGICVA